MKTAATTLLILLALAPSLADAGPPALEPPSREALSEARELVASMSRLERGPYRRLRWWCADGSVHPPRPYPCRERGGGVQHAELSSEAQRLAELGFHVGTIHAALSWEELWNPSERNLRLRELPLENYLVDIKDGWVLRRARSYRGRIQVETEEDRGWQALVRILSNSDWVAGNLLLARESVRAIPHHDGAGDRTREIRRLSKALAVTRPSFMETRVRIHTHPGLLELAETRDFLAATHEPMLTEGETQLARDLERELALLFGREGRLGRFERSVRAMSVTPVGRELRDQLTGVMTLDAEDRLARLARVMMLCRESVTASGRGASNLMLMDLSVEAEQALREAAFEILDRPGLSRQELLGSMAPLLDAAHGAGLLGTLEHADLSATLAKCTTSDQVSIELLSDSLSRLQAAAPMALGNVRHAFAEAMSRYTALEPEAATFPDDLVRGSALLPLAKVLERLAADLERLRGARHLLLGMETVGLNGLNPGVAMGPLLLLDDEALSRGDSIAPESIVVLSRTLPELPPVAGILTVAEGNVLSHVQVLARNLGIPNAVLSRDAFESLRSHEGESVLLGVAADGRVVLTEEASVPATVLQELNVEQDSQTTRVKVRAPIPDLLVTSLLPLSELHGGLSGRLVGPKAAHLGDLARVFPGRVAPAIAIPFGLFAHHADSESVLARQRLAEAFTAHREGSLDSRQLSHEVEEVREAVSGITLDESLRVALREEMRRQFGEPGTYGLFIRSDTNVEDLPGFTGAGLNKTVPHVVEPASQLAAIPRVWASPFTARAMGWRAAGLQNPEDVHPSVLLMKSVPAQKSGVLVTRDIVTGGEGLTVATAWGVGGAVDGEAAETLILRPDGSFDLVSEAKAPYQRRLLESGGVGWVPAPSGPVLDAKERAALLSLAVELGERLPVALRGEKGETALDVEFGFVDGELTLFQVRPLVAHGAELADRCVELTMPSRPPLVDCVDLDSPLSEPGWTRSPPRLRAVTARRDR